MTAITASDIQTKIVDGVTAFEAGDYQTALNKLEAAQMLMSAIPRTVLGTAQARNEIEYDVEKLNAMIDRVKQRASLQRMGGTLVQTPIERVRTRDE